MKRYLVLFALGVLLFAAGCTSSEYKAFIAAGNDAIHEGDYETALKNYSKAISEKKTEEATTIYAILEQMQAGITAYEAGDFADSIELFNEIGNLDTKEYPILKKVKRDLEAFLKQAEEALETYTELMEQLDEGKEKLATGSFAEAIALFEKVAEYVDKTDHPKIKSLVEEAKTLTEQAKKDKENELAEQKRTEDKPQKEEELKEKQEAEQKQKAEEPKQAKAEKPAKITPDEAKKLVHQYLINYHSGDPLENANVHLNYDHERENGDYIFQLFEVVIDDPETKEGHTATWGWYGVDPVTKKVYDAMNN